MDNDKLIAWLTKAWNVKERIVFALMVGVLAFRVYQILVEPPVPPPSAPPLPGVIPFTPPEPAPPRGRSDGTQYIPVYAKPDMFMERKADDVISTDGAPKETDLKLHSIQVSRSRGPMAQLSLGDGSKSYQVEGDAFESDYTVKKIDVAKQEVQVYDSAKKKTFTLKIEEKE